MDALIRLFEVQMSPDAIEDVGVTLQSGFIAQGPKVDRFEDELAPWVGTKPVSLNSGTSALTLALRLAGVGPGDEVITTPMTCAATNLPILAAGARPVWADIDPRTGLLDPFSIWSRLTSRTRAIMVVDWGGQPADYDELRRLTLYAEPRGLALIEDAAHAFGATYKGAKVGTLADFTCFSFQAIKHLTTGDGGALTTNSSEARKRARVLRWFGIDRDAPTAEFRGEQDIEEWGYKFHMNDIAATIGLANLSKLRFRLPVYRDHARILNELLDERFERTAPTYEHEGAWWIYTVLLPDEETRNEFKRWAPAHGLQVSQVHWRNDRLSVFLPYARADLPGVDEFSSRMVCLPVHPNASPQRVAEIANRFFE